MWIVRSRKATPKFLSIRSVGSINTEFYDGSERQYNYAKSQLLKLHQTMKALEQERYFNYEKKEAKYDPKTGKIELFDANQREPKRIIKNFDDLEKERQRLHKELKLGTEEAAKATVDELSERYVQLYQHTQEGYIYDQKDAYAETHDHMRIDCGLLIQRLPIFLHYHKFDHEFLKFRQRIMNEYDIDQRQYYEEFKKETQLLESLFANNSYVSITNRDNLPTHGEKLENGSTKYYCGASKNWKKVDPSVTDHKSMHYGSSQRAYLIFKNKHTSEWEFPTTKLFSGDSFLEARKRTFMEIAKDKWIIRHEGKSPVVATLRPFTPYEREDRKNSILSGVRTFYFHAYHLRGLPEFDFDTSDFNDYAWVTRADMNKFLTKEKFEIFKPVFRHR